MQKFFKHHGAALIVWVVVCLAAMIGMPNITTLVRDHGNTTIPANMQSQVATAIQNKWGKGQSNARQVAVVFSNGDHKLTKAQQTSINATIEKLQNNQSHYHITSIMAPSDNAETKKQLVSKDGTTQIVQLMVSKHTTVQAMTTQLTKAVKTHNVTTSVTGGDILNESFNEATEAGVQKTEVIAAIFIFVVLIIVFRSPIVPVISLTAVGVAMLTSLSVVMNLVKHFGFPLSAFTQAFMVVILFGIGTDYNILLYDQFKEELAQGLDKLEATKQAVKVAGHTILYSGSSVLIGFSVLGLAKFSIYRSAVGVAVGIAILLLVLLTLNPFFMATLGDKMFWPVKNLSGASHSKLWEWLSAKSILHPLIAILLMLGCAVPVALLYNNDLNYDTVVELSDNAPAKQGFELIQKHFSKGTAEPSTIYIQADHKLNNNETLKVIDQLTRKLKQDPDIKTVTSVTQPGGSEISDLYVKKQLNTVTTGMDQAHSGISQINSGLKSAQSQLASADMQSGLNGVKQLISGTDQLISGSNQLHSGTTQLATGANTLQNGLGQYTNAVAQINAGTTQLADKSGELTAGISTLTQQTSQLPMAVAGLTAYTTGINGGINQINSALSSQAGSLNQLNSAQCQLTTLASESQTMRTQLASAKKLEPQLDAAIKLLDQLQSAKANLSSLQTKATALQSTLNTVKSSMTQVMTRNVAAISAERAIITAAQAIIDDDTASTASKQAAQTILTKANANLANNLQKNNTAMTGMANQTSNLAMPDLTQLDKLAQVLPTDAQINELKSELTNAKALMNSAENMLDQADDLSTQADQLGQVATAFAQLQTGLKTLQTNSNEAVSIAQQLNSGVNGSGVDLTDQTTIAQTIGNSSMTQQLSTLSSGVSQYVTGVNTVANGVNQVNANSGSLTSGAQQLTTGADQLNASVPSLTAGLVQVRNGQQTMYTTLSGLTTQMKALQTGLGSATDGLTQINTGVTQANSYLTGLKQSTSAKEFYIPKSTLKSKAFKPALDQYLSKDQTATQLTVVLKADPSSTEALTKVNSLQKEVKNQLKGTSLKNAKVAVGGQTAFTSDTKTVATSDFMRTAAIMVIGIAIALIFVTRSLLQPVYILLSLLFAYFASLTITRGLSTVILDQSQLTWTTPFFAFIMLIALGVDYSIFLMMKYREFGVESRPRIAITQAAGVIGAVVISAAIILGGTFAALMPSGVLTLIQVATAVMIGLTILVFVLPITMSAGITLTYDRKNE